MVPAARGAGRSDISGMADGERGPEGLVAEVGVVEGRAMEVGGASVDTLILPTMWWWTRKEREEE
jgi:hypothetical protein